MDIGAGQQQQMPTDGLMPVSRSSQLVRRIFANAG